MRKKGKQIKLYSLWMRISESINRLHCISLSSLRIDTSQEPVRSILAVLCMSWLCECTQFTTSILHLFLSPTLSASDFSPEQLWTMFPMYNHFKKYIYNNVIWALLFAYVRRLFFFCCFCCCCCVFVVVGKPCVYFVYSIYIVVNATK